MAALASPGKRKNLVLAPLDVVREDPAAAVDFHAVHVLDVGGAAPCCHQPIGGRASILVREDDGVAIAQASRRRLVLVPHEHRHVRELTERIGTRIQEWRKRNGRMLPVTLRHARDVDPLYDGCITLQVRAGQLRIQVGLKHMPACRNATDHHRVIRAAAANER